MRLPQILESLLTRHDEVPIVVLPCMCVGLDGFPPTQPLLLNLGHALKPDMMIQVDDRQIAFRASFKGVVRAVSVPWPAVLFAGRREDLDELLRQAPPPSPVTSKNENVVSVDFRRGRP